MKGLDKKIKKHLKSIQPIDHYYDFNELETRKFIKQLVKDTCEKVINDMEKLATYGEYNTCPDDSECGEVIPIIAIKYARDNLKKELGDE